MRRKQDDKRVLRPGNGRQNTSKRKIRRSNNNYNRQLKSRTPHNYQKNKRKRKRSRYFILVMVVALIAFVIGAGIGVSLSLDNAGEDEGPQYKNVTDSMTSGLNDTEQVYFDSNTDNIDYNENGSQLTIQYKYGNEN